MNTEETKQLLHRVSTTYYYAFKDKTTDEKRQILKEWTNAFEKESFDTMSERLNDHIKKNKYAPTIADLTTIVRGNNFANYEQNNQCTKEEWDNMVDLYNRFYNKEIKVGKLVDEYLEKQRGEK